MMYFINVIKSKCGCFRERGSPLIHLSRTIIDCPRCTRSGLLLAVSKRLNQASDTMRSVATVAIICHCDDGADSIQLLPWARVAAPGTVCKWKFLNLHHYSLTVMHWNGWEVELCHSSAVKNLWDQFTDCRNILSGTIWFDEGERHVTLHDVLDTLTDDTTQLGL